MIKAIVSLQLIFTIFVTLGQEHGGLLTQETLIKNSVHTIFQYSITDSVQFMTDYPNGYYSIFNEDGRIIVSNNYSQSFGPKAESIWDEYKNYYFYNDAGDRIGFIQMYVDSEEPFRVIHLTSFDSESNKVHTVDLETNSDLETEFVFREEELKDRKLFFGDTLIIGKLHKRSYVTSDSTMFEDIYFNSSNRIDSTIFHSKSYGKRETQSDFLTTTFQYTADNKLRSKTRSYRSKTLDSPTYSVTIVNYNENGLIESIENQNKRSDSRELMKYIYTFRE